MTIEEAVALKKHQIIHIIEDDSIDSTGSCHPWRIRANSKVWVSRPGYIDVKLIWLGRTRTLNERDIPFIHLEKDCSLKMKV